VNKARKAQERQQRLKPMQQKDRFRQHPVIADR
jgi:hypothetical protein